VRNGRRRGAPEDIAKVTAFPTSSEAGDMTGGDVLVGDVLVDGGRVGVPPATAWRGNSAFRKLRSSRPPSPTPHHCLNRSGSMSPPATRPHADRMKSHTNSTREK
jgi:hypothetical protein